MIQVQIEADREWAMLTLYSVIENNMAIKKAKFISNLIVYYEQKKTVDKIKKEFKAKVTNLGYVKIKEKFK